jgi:hypothetical protein
VCAAIELLIRSADGIIQTTNTSETVAGQISWLFSYSPFGFWFSWSIGALLADAFLKKQPLPFLKNSPVTWLVLATIGYFVKPLYSFQFLCFAIATGAILGRILTGNTPVLKMPRWSLNGLTKVGLWSYSIYLLHQPLLNAFTLVIVKVIPTGYFHGPLLFAGFVMAWLGIAFISFLWYEIFERPSVILGKQIAQKKTAVLDLKARWLSIKCPVLVALTTGVLLISARLTPTAAEEDNNHAWSLATDPDPSRRNGALAVKLAENACAKTQFQKPIMLGTLAAAYAEARRFDDAIATAQRACVLAVQLGDNVLLQRNQELMSLYLKHEPFHAQAADSIQR